MKKEIKLGAILGYINMFLNIFVSIVYIPFMLKMMGQSEYGLYSLVASVIAYLSVLDMGFGNAMIRFVSRSQAQKDSKESNINGMFLFLYTIIGIVALVIGAILIKNVSFIFSNSLTANEIGKAKILMMILVANVALSFPLSVFDSYIIANERYTYTKILTIIKTLLKPALMIPLLMFGYKSIAMTSVIALINIFYHIAMLIYCFKVLKMKINFSFKNFDKKLLKEIGGYSFFIFLNIIVDNIFNNTDQIILGIVSGTIAVSIYAVANQIVQMNTQCSTVISSLFLPRITKTLEESEAEKKVSNLFIKVSRIQLYIMMLIMFGFVVFGKFFIQEWAGIEYIDAYYIILLIIVPSIIPLTQNLGISVIQAKNKHQFRSVVYIIIAILNILISIPLARKYQGIGAAIGTAFANFCGQIVTMNIFYYKKIKLDIPEYWKFFLKIFLQYLILSVAFLFIFSKIQLTMVTFLMAGIVFVMLYGLISYFNMNGEEKAYVEKILSKFGGGK